MGFKKAIISTVAAAVMATASFGATEVADNQKGNYLIFPAYYGVGEWQTNLRLVNTNTQDAIVAKVIVKRYSDSHEVLDFYVFLSPGDVWTADVVEDGAGAKLVSTDDSMITNYLTGAKLVSVDNPIDQPFLSADVEIDGDTSCHTETEEKFGYVEAMVVAQKPAIEIDPSWKLNTPLSKLAIFNSFSVDKKIDPNNPSDPRDNNWIAGDDNSIYGQALITAVSASGQNRSMTEMATAFKGAFTDNNVTSMTVKDTLLGEPPFFANNLESNSNYTNPMFYSRIDAALKTTHAYVTFYENSAETKLLFTQPTQLWYRTSAVDSPWWEEKQNGGCVDYNLYYSARGRDNMENTFLPEPTPPSDHDYSPYVPDPDEPVTYTTVRNEIAQIPLQDPMTDYESGYIDVAIEGENPLNPNGSAPGIPSVMTGVTVNGTQIVNIYKPAKD